MSLNAERIIKEDGSIMEFKNCDVIHTKHVKERIQSVKKRLKEGWNAKGWKEIESKDKEFWKGVNLAIDKMKRDINKIFLEEFGKELLK